MLRGWISAILEIYQRFLTRYQRILQHNDFPSNTYVPLTKTEKSRSQNDYGMIIIIQIPVRQRRPTLQE